MKFNYNAKCIQCGNTREVKGFKRKIRKFNPIKPAFTYVKCPKCGASNSWNHRACRNCGCYGW